MNIKVRPWQTPNYVTAEMPPTTRQEGWKQVPTWHVRDVDAETLAWLCDEFRREVFAKADKIDPASKLFDSSIPLYQRMADASRQLSRLRAEMAAEESK